ncbi:MAG: DUF4268 domain-containing protein [Acidimicrobiia bacterium]|nr:DUF4268 domain-containing protein [Acidimicrobiia bacterium]
MTVPSPPREFKLIDIREVWPCEAQDFTPWLAENLEVLSEHLEIGELGLGRTEVDVPGGRRLDILAKDSSGRNWAVENQYGEADHDHLTRALAYAVGLECRAVIVVAESHRDEFVAVADEWNRYSEAYGSDGIRLFLVAIEAGRIGESAPGFRFRLVAGPNEWRSGGLPPIGPGDRHRRDMQEKFWAGLQKAMSRKGALFRATRVVSSYVTIASKGPFSFQFWVLTNSCRVQLRIESGNQEQNDELYDSLASHRDVIQDALDTELVWENKPNLQSSRIYWFPEGACGWRSPADEREAGYEVLADAMTRFHDTLMPYLKDLI